MVTRPVAEPVWLRAVNRASRRLDERKRNRRDCECHSESTSALDGPGRGQKTATGITMTAHGQKGSETSHGESAFVHETANDPWSKSVTLETVNGHSDALHKKLDLTREINVKSESESGPG